MSKEIVIQNKNHGIKFIVTCPHCECDTDVASFFGSELYLDSFNNFDYNCRHCLKGFTVYVDIQK